MGLEAKISANIDDFQRNLNRAQQAATDFSERASKSFEKLGQSIQKLALPAAAASLAISAIGLSAVKTFAELEGVKAAFDRLNNPDLLNNLRKATKGTTSDFELMKNAVQASNFKLPVEQLASLMEFASRRAKDTGESVDYLVNSIVTGIGRKSPLILDNLGISATELKKQLKGVSMEAASIASVTEAVGRIASAELQKIGKDSDTLAEKFLRIKTIFTNEMGGMGETISKSLRPAIDAIEKLALKFQALDPETKNMIVYIGAGIAAFTGLVAAAGALITIAPLIAAAWAAIGGPIALVATAIVASAVYIATHWNEVKSSIVNASADILIATSGLILSLASVAGAVGSAGLEAKLKAAAIATGSLGASWKSAVFDARKLNEFIEMNAFINANAATNAAILAGKNKELEISLNGAGKAAKRAHKNFWELNAVMALNGKKLVSRKVQEKDPLRTLDRGATIEAGNVNFGKLFSAAEIAAQESANLFNEIFGRVVLDTDTVDMVAEKMQIARDKIANAVSGISENIGQALASGGNVIEAFGKGLLDSFGDFLSNFGKKLVAYGLAAGAFAKLQLAMTNPITAIPAAGLAVAAGIALQIAGAAAKSAAVMGNSNSSGSGGGYSNSAVKMSDPTNYYKSTPLNITISGEFVQRGDDLRAVVSSANNKAGRIR